MKTYELKIGDQFIYTTPLGREITYTVDCLYAETPQRTIMPRARSTTGQHVFISGELLEQDWWRPVPNETP